MNTGVTLITMGAGNVLALRKTLESFRHVCDEVIYGDMLLFEEDREIVRGYSEEFNMKIIRFSFNYLFKNGFSSLLNQLAGFASNDMVMYMNTSEVIDEDYGIIDLVKNNQDCNAFYFTHRTDPHRWFRLYDRTELRWSGRIHEQLEGEYKPYHKPVFMMADLHKDMHDPYKAIIFDIAKEIVYFNNYCAIHDNPEEWGATDPGWMRFIKENYDSFKERMKNKGGCYEAYVRGDLKLFFDTIHSTIPKMKYESNVAIEYQNDKKYLL